MKKLEELEWHLIMEEPKEPASLEELYQILFPLNDEVKDEFEKYENLINLLIYVRIKLKDFKLNDVYDTYIIERVLRLYNKIDEYDLSMEFAKSARVGIFLDEVLKGENKQDTHKYYKELMLNYLVAKYKSEGLENIDFEHCASFFLEIKEKNWINPTEYHETLVEIYLQILLQGNISHEMHERLILRFPVFYLKNTHLHYLIMEEDYLKILGDYFKQYYDSINFNNLSPLLKQLIKFVQMDLWSDGKDNLINSPLSIIKNLTKKTVESYENLCKELIDCLLEFVTEQFFEDEKTTITAVDSYLKILKECEKAVYKTNLLKECHFQKREVHLIFSKLYDCQKYREFYQIYKCFLGEEQRILVKEELTFQCAYVFNEMGNTEEAKQTYEEMLKENEKFASVYNNLAVIYMSEKNYEKALELLEQGKLLEPDHKNINTNLKNVNNKIEEIKQRPKKMKDIYFKKTERIHKKIIFAIYKLEDEFPITNEKLMKITKLSNENYFKKLLKTLLDFEVVLTSQEKGYVLDDTIYKLVEDYIDPQLEREVVRVNQNKFFRPIFYHESEINLYRVLNELFPQHFVFPNMDLKTIIDVSKIRGYLETDVLEYMFKAHVDFAIIDTTTYFPIIAFEKDSEYQDKEPQKSNAIKKNTIFQTSGLPLIRLRYSSAMDYERLKEEIKQATKAFVLEIKAENQEDELLKHFDLKRLGIYEELPSIEELENTWSEVVGKLVAEKTQSMTLDNEQAILTINISTEVEPIIKISQENIKGQMYQRVNALNQIRIFYQD